MLEFDPENDTIKIVASYLHGHEVWHLAPHPTETSTIVTIGNEGAGSIQSNALDLALCCHLLSTGLS